MPARGGDFERALGAGLALDVLEVLRMLDIVNQLRIGNRLRRLNGQLAGQMPDCALQRFDRIERDSLDAAHLV